MLLVVNMYIQLLKKNQKHVYYFVLKNQNRHNVTLTNYIIQNTIVKCFSHTNLYCMVSIYLLAASLSILKRSRIKSQIFNPDIFLWNNIEKIIVNSCFCMHAIFELLVPLK